ncbi:MAG TPA: histidine kinase [Sulfurimonas sp. UBA12504]|nr:MAG: histidine kinase [Sulfurimonas sp. GWF2_37_8]DAB30911.1 MAG TPA: histidine kinase [Sulfurimonas sp. UBA12504]
MKSSIIESIKSLPPLSKTITDINMVYANEDSSIHDLAKVIERDPMIVANLLKAANSPLYGFGKEIRNATQAVTLFGMSLTRSIAVGNSIRKLLNVDMKPYNITSERFAEISSLQANLILKWYSHIDKQKAEMLYLAAFLQETGKILIASDVIQEDESYSFAAEVEFTNDLPALERSYVNVSSSEVTAEIFDHWGFDQAFIEMIKYSDNPEAAPSKIKEYALALNIIKTVLPINKPLSDQAISFGLRKAYDAGYNHEILEDEIDSILETQASENE